MINLPPRPQRGHFEVRNSKGETLLCEPSPNGEVPWPQVRQDAAFFGWGHNYVALSEGQLWREYEAAQEAARLAARSPEKVAQDERDAAANRAAAQKQARWDVENHTYTRKPTARDMDPGNPLI